MENVPNIEEVSAEEKAQIVAQAKAIRALMYWHLTEAWDDVPLITTLLGPEELQIPSNDALDIYAQMVADLEEAADVLPEVWSGNDYGKITSGAANALLARVHLFFYGYHGVSDGAQRAAAATQKIIDSGVYGLFPDYEQLFTQANEDSEEVVWSIRFSSDLSGNNAEGFSYSFNAVPQSNNYPLQNFVDAFYCTDGLPIDQSPLYDPANYWENRDPRWDATIVYQNEQWLENRPPFNINPAPRRTGYAIDKYVINNNEGLIQGNGAQDWYVFRYADVLLMHAEALIETGNTGPEVYDLINQVRQRVNMPTIESVEGSGLSAAELTDILRHERRVELAFENTRFMDLKRWGTMAEAYERSGGDTKIGRNNPILSGVAYQGERSIILPIPQQELDANINLEQHPAWR
ncbi:MAG: RagB/SusD family nutrient uptake outer membrane protein [Bacteroidota bacterium]